MKNIENAKQLFSEGLNEIENKEFKQAEIKFLITYFKYNSTILKL